MLFSSVNAAQPELVLNYDGFFDRLDDLNEPEYADVTLGFFFKQVKNGEPCHIKSARLQSQTDSMKVYFLGSGEVLLPFDEQLDMDKAKLIIEKSDDVDCGLNMQLQTKTLFKEKVSLEKANKLITTFDLALDELAGMMSFLTPDVNGITFIGDGQVPLSIKNNFDSLCSDAGCTLSRNQLDKFKGMIEFNYAPVKAIPYIEK